MISKGVLVVEDEPALVSIYRRALENRGFRVLTEADGEEEEDDPQLGERPDRFRV